MAEKVTVEVDESGNPFVIKSDGKKFRLYQKGSTFGLKTAVAPRGHGKFVIEVNHKTRKMVCKPKAAEDKIKGAKYVLYLRNGLLMCRTQLPVGARSVKEEKEQNSDGDEIISNVDEQPSQEKSPVSEQNKGTKSNPPIAKLPPKKVVAPKKTLGTKKVIAKK